MQVLSFRHTKETSKNVMGTTFKLKLGVVVYTCNPATLEAELWNSAESIIVVGNTPTIDEWTE